MPQGGEHQEVLRLLREQMSDLRESYGVRSLAVFGSVARGSAQEGSDLDILVRFESDPPGLLRFLELEGYLAELLDAKVDLVMETALKPSLKDRILAEAIAA
ncbi:MAG: nucleotidyltransferase [Nitrospirae bacterium]|nr:nucleotidyltransferase [Nitrospirota bacterium]